MPFVALFDLSMWCTLVSALLVAIWLATRRHEEPALLPLAGFCLAMSCWCGGHLFASAGYPGPALPLLLANPLLPTTFLHFVWRWLGHPHSPQYILGLYTVALLVSFTSWLFDGGQLTPWRQFEGFFILQQAGWYNLAYTISLGLYAHLQLLVALWREHPHLGRDNQRRSIIAIFIAGGWGFGLATSFVLPSLAINIYPYPMLALPSYAILVVYAVVRYQLVEVNRWANRAVIWLATLTASLLMMSLLLALLAPLGLTALKQVPIAELMIYSACLLAIAFACYGPAKQFADRLVYPGAVVDEPTLEHWITQLNQSHNWQQLSDQAEHLWQQHSGVGARLILTDSAVLEPTSGPTTPEFYCYYDQQWRCQLRHWQQQSPAQQHQAELFATLLPSACAGLQRSLALATAEREQLAQQHLVELGALTATIAHELRNPLNIIQMAACQTTPPIKRQIGSQVERAELLIRDVLTYAGQLHIQPQRLELASLTDSVCQQIEALFHISIEQQLESPLYLHADPQRLQQVLINLLENAVAFVGGQAAPQIHVIAKHNQSGIELAIHNNGPAIPTEMQAQLFQPFVSKRSGGSGLGLAIVRRIIDSHQGQIWHSQDRGWPVSFVIHLPVDQPPHEI